MLPLNLRIGGRAGDRQQSSPFGVETATADEYLPGQRNRQIENDPRRSRLFGLGGSRRFRWRAIGPRIRHRR